MTDSAIRTLEEVDVVLYLVDDRADFGPGDEYMINLLKEVKTPKFLIINKIDKVSNRDKERIISSFIEGAQQFGIELINLDKYHQEKNRNKLPYLEFSALKKLNLGKLNHFIYQSLKNI